MCYAEKYPERVGKLVLASPVRFTFFDCTCRGAERLSCQCVVACWTKRVVFSPRCILGIDVCFQIRGLGAQSPILCCAFEYVCLTAC